MLHWILLYGAIVLEVAGTTCMKLSRGFSVLIPSVLTFAFYWASLAALTIAVKTVPISSAYAIWSGLGTTLTAIIGVVHFNDPINTIKIVSLGLVILGVIGLNLNGNAH
jgi:small multidrug resistance pump